MRNRSERRITVDIDTIVAIAGAIAGLLLCIWLATTTENRLYPIFAILSFLACVTYLVVKKRLLSVSISELFEERRGKPSTYLLLNTLFFVFMSYTLIAVALRPDLYSRPLGYFVCTALASAVLAVEILLLPPSKSYAYFVLAKIMLVSLSLIWTPQLIFPSLLGFDPHAHGQFTEAILDDTHIPTGESYSAFPVMHLTSGATMLLTDLGYKMATMLSICLMYVIVGLAIIFLLGRFIHSSRIGLLAALLLGCTAYYVHWGWWMVPNSYAAIFLPAIAYLLFKAREQHPLRLLTLSMLLMATLILTHTMAALCMAIVLFLFWLGYRVYVRVYLARFKIPVTLTLCILFGIAMFGWWMYTAPHTLKTIQDLREYGFAAEYFYQPAGAAVEYLQTAPFLEYLLRNLSYFLFWAISFVGCLAAFSQRLGNRHSVVLALGGLTLLSIGFFSLPMELAVIPGRWQFVSIFLLATAAGFGLLFVCHGLREGSKRLLLLPLLVAGLSFISIMSPLTNIDNPILFKNTTVRYALKESEIQEGATISNLWDTEVVTDDIYGGYFPGTAEVHPMADNLLTRDFADRKGMLVVIREEIAERPFHLPGVFKLSYDPREVLSREQGFSQIYDGGTVSAFWQSAE